MEPGRGRWNGSGPGGALQLQGTQTKCPLPPLRWEMLRPHEKQPVPLLVSESEGGGGGAGGREEERDGEEDKGKEREKEGGEGEGKKDEKGTTFTSHSDPQQ